MKKFENYEKRMRVKFFNYTISLKPETLISVYGEPQYYLNDGKNPINMIWILNMNGEKVIVCDGNEFRPVSLDETIHFQIGSDSYDLVVEAKKEIENDIAKFYQLIINH